MTNLGRETSRGIYLLLVTFSAAAIALLFWIQLGQRDTLQEQVNANTRALCLLKNEYRDRVHRDIVFLRTHPHADTRPLIVEVVNNSRSILRSLVDVTCPKGTP